MLQVSSTPHCVVQSVLQDACYVEETEQLVPLPYTAAANQVLCVDRALLLLHADWPFPHHFELQRSTRREAEGI